MIHDRLQQVHVVKEFPPSSFLYLITLPILIKEHNYEAPHYVILYSSLLPNFSSQTLSVYLLPLERKMKIYIYMKRVRSGLGL